MSEETKETSDGAREKPKGWRHPFFLGLLAVSLLLVVIDGVWMVTGTRHGHVGPEDVPGIYGAFGFVAFWLIVIAGKYFRKLVARDEDYYDRG